VFADHADRANPGAKYDYARVISSDPVIRHVTVKTPVRECWEETEYYSVSHRPAGGGILFGAIVGSVIGHQFGSGHGNDAATIAGGLIGAAIGSDASRSRYSTRSGRHEEARVVERCETQIRQHQEERIDGYRVVYRYNGQKYATTMPNDPGSKIRVRVDVRPAG
jgi:uncharacterized protein YcfJ